MRSAFGIEHTVSKGVPKGMTRLRLNVKEPNNELTEVTAHRRKKHLGSLHLHHAPGQPHHGEIAAVNVNPNKRRKGLATALFQHAERKGLKPTHTNWRTDEGDAWAKSVGGKIPKRFEWGKS